MKRLLIPLLLAFVIIGCGTPVPRADSIEDAIVVTSANIETAADQLQDLCGNTVPRGQCRAGALVDTDTKERLRLQLQEALDAVRLANLAVSNDDNHDASDSLGRAQALLTLVRSELARREQ